MGRTKGFLRPLIVYSVSEFVASNDDFCQALTNLRRLTIPFRQFDLDGLSQIQERIMEQFTLLQGFYLFHHGLKCRCCCAFVK
jgi:hypothetical protein